MKGRATFTAFTSSLLLALAGGAAQAGGPGGSYLQGAYVDWDDLDDGYNVAGSIMAGPQARLFAEFTDTDLQQLRLGAGWVIPMQNQGEFELGASYQRFELDFNGNGILSDADDDGIGVHVALRFPVTAEFTLGARAEYVFLDDFNDETIIGVDADFKFVPQFSVFGAFDFYDELDNNLWKVGARFHF